MEYYPIRKDNQDDFENWLKMAIDLWPKHDKDDLKKELADILKTEKEGVFLVKDNDEYIGFADFSIRFDYVQGAKSSPVGYLEGIYVKPKYRKKGIASQLVKLIEKWAAKKGCKELASDTWLWHKDAQTFHKNLGFQEKDTLVHFIKKIDVSK